MNDGPAWDWKPWPLAHDVLNKTELLRLERRGDERRGEKVRK